MKSRDFTEVLELTYENFQAVASSYPDAEVFLLFIFIFPENTEYD